MLEEYVDQVKSKGTWIGLFYEVTDLVWANPLTWSSLMYYSQIKSDLPAEDNSYTSLTVYMNCMWLIIAAAARCSTTL